MDNVKGILILLVLALAASSFVLFVRMSTAQAAAEGTDALATATKELLRLQDKPCPDAAPERIAANCIQPLLAAKDFKEDAFRQPRDGVPGYLVIKNVNRRAYDAERFIFNFNRETLQTGCTIPGTIDYNVVCRFEFPQACNDGDVLEVFYPVQNNEPARVFLRTC